MIRSALDWRGYGQISHKSLQFRRVIWPVWETSGVVIRQHSLTHMRSHTHIWLCRFTRTPSKHTPHTWTYGWGTLTGSPGPCDCSLSIAVPSYKYRVYKCIRTLYYSNMWLMQVNSRTLVQRHLNPIRPVSRLRYILLCGSLTLTSITLSSKPSLPSQSLHWGSWHNPQWHTINVHGL